MGGCCDPSGYRRVFGPGEARRSLAAFRRRGLDSTAAPMVEALRGQAPGATVLEVGAGTGAAQVELLRAGAARAIWVDISPEYRDAAVELAVDHGVEDRIERHVGDFVTLATGIAPARIVFLNRVVCCYPDMPALVDAAAGHATSRLALSYPRTRWLMRVGIRILNGVLRLQRAGFRVFVHDPEAVAGRLEAAGLRPVAAGRTPFWEWGVWGRPSGEDTGSG